MTETQKQPKNNRLKWQKTKRHDSKTVSCYCQLNLASLNASRCQIWSYLYRSDWGSVSNSKVMQTWSRKAIYYNYFYLSRSKSVIFFYCINCPMKIIELTKHLTKHSKRGLILCPVRLGRRPLYVYKWLEGGDVLHTERSTSFLFHSIANQSTLTNT